MNEQDVWKRWLLWWRKSRILGRVAANESGINSPGGAAVNFGGSRLDR